MGRGDAIAKGSPARAGRGGSGPPVTSAPRMAAITDGGQVELLGTMREHIIAGLFGPNDRLKFEDLRGRYQASVGALRESLLQLQSEGLVRLEANRGFTVAPISVADFMDITELRVQFEKQALLDAIGHGNDQWEAEIVTSLHLLLKSTDGEAPPANSPDWPTRHRRFHSALVAACRSPWLLHFRGTLFDQAERYRSLGRKYRRSPRDVAAEHKALADAVLSRDADLACELAERHIRSTVENVLKNVPGLSSPGDENGSH